MKRIICSIVLLAICICAGLAESMSLDTASHVIVLDLAKANKAKVGLYSRSITNNDLYSNIQSIATYDLKLVEAQAVDDDNVFLFWQIISDKKHQVRLSLAGPLKPADGSGPIDLTLDCGGVKIVAKADGTITYSANGVATGNSYGIVYEYAGRPDSGLGVASSLPVDLYSPENSAFQKTTYFTNVTVTLVMEE